MIVYQDRTYCVSNDCCNDRCVVRLTDDIVEKAAIFGLPVSIADESKNCNCYIKKTDI